MFLSFIRNVFNKIENNLHCVQYDYVNLTLMQRRNITLNMTRFVKVKISTETYRFIQSDD